MSDSKPSCRMYYRALFTIPIEFDVEVMKDDMLLDEAAIELKAKALEVLNQKYGQVLGMDFKHLEMIPNTFQGCAVDCLTGDRRLEMEERIKWMKKGK